MASNQIDLIIKATNKASPTIKQVQGDLGSLEKTATGAGASLGDMALGLAKGAAIGLGIVGVQQLTQAITDLAVSAGKVQQLRASFDGLATGVGQSSNAMLGAMREASGGMVSDADLILSANKAMLLGVADTAEELAALLNVARSRGAAMGLSTTQAFNDIVTGLGRESALILDNLGITINLEKVMSAYAASLGTTAEKLDATQRKQALLNEVMRSSAGMTAPVETAAAAWERASAAIENAKVALGELFGPVVAEILSGVAGVATATADMFNGDVIQKQITQITGDLSLYRNALQETENQIAAYRAQVAAGMEPNTAYISDQIMLRQQQKKAIADLEAQLKPLNAAQAENAKITALANTEIQTAAQFYPSMADGMAMLGTSGKVAGSGMSIAESAANKLKAALAALAGQSDATGNSLRSAFMGAAGALGAAQALSGYQAATQQLQLLRQEWAYMGLTADQVAFKEAEFFSRTQTGLQDQQQAIKDATKAMSNYAASGVDAASKSFDALTSKVSSLVSGMTSLSEIGGGPKATGDAANENAKRMAAIANEGIIGQTWLDDFKNEVPSLYAEVMAATDPKAFATTWVQDFQAGLHPEALDREMIKANIKRMILGEATMAAYVAEIAAEIKADPALANVSTAIVDGVTGALTNKNMGQAIGATTVASVNTPAAITEFQNAGESAFGSWKAGWDNAANNWRPPLPNTPPGAATNPLGGAGTTYGGLTQQGNVYQPPITAPLGSTSTSSSSGRGAVAVTVNINGVAGNPTQIGMAARSSVLDALRGAGVR